MTSQLPDKRGPSPLRVVVLTCGDLGFEVANRLAGSSDVIVAGVVTSPYVQRQRTPRQKVKYIIRTQGVWGLGRVALAKVLPALDRDRRAEEASIPLDPSIPCVHVENFHALAGLAAIRAFSPDLAVVAGTYILRPEVFEIPRFGSINLHSGRVPEYRGAAPAFWEIYHGESEVGITIHRVSSDLDAGDVLLQRTFPVDNAPSDPIEYIERYRSTVLRPNGIAMIREVVEAIAGGTAAPVAQIRGTSKPYRTPDHRAIVELKRRVRARRTRR